MTPIKPDKMRQLANAHPSVVPLLCEILDGEVTAANMVGNQHYIELLQNIGGNHALNALQDPTGRRLAHWPRVWAARALARIGNPSCDSSFTKASRDAHWRVRMQAVRAAGLVSSAATVDEMADILVADDHPRVRQAVALALGRQGTKRSAMRLGELCRDSEVAVRRAAARAELKFRSRQIG